MSAWRWCFLAALLIPTATRADDHADFLLLPGNGPVVLRLHLLVDGQPAATVRGHYFDKLFADLDRDGDASLSKTEAARAPSVAFLLSFLNGGTAAEAKDNIASLAEYDADRDGRVTRAEYDAYYRRAALDRVGLIAAPPDHEAAALTDVLFRHLDRDRDGKLSRSEMKQAAEALRPVDTNDDEWIGLDELLLARLTDETRPKSEAPLLLPRTADEGRPGTRP